jgi:hypothetical protein
MARALHAPVPAVFSGACFLDFWLFVCVVCIFFSCFTVYRNSSCFKLVFLALWVKNLFL